MPRGSTIESDTVFGVGQLSAAIAARGIWNSYIDFPLGLAATGGLTSGSAVSI